MYRILQEEGIDLPRYAVLNRDPDNPEGEEEFSFFVLNKFVCMNHLIYDNKLKQSHLLQENVLSNYTSVIYLAACRTWTGHIFQCSVELLLLCFVNKIGCWIYSSFNLCCHFGQGRIGNYIMYHSRCPG